VKSTTGETEWGVDGDAEQEREREREREKQINGGRDGALDRIGSGMGQKWTLDKLNT